MKTRVIKILYGSAAVALITFLILLRDYLGPDWQFPVNTLSTLAVMGGLAFCFYRVFIHVLREAKNEQDRIKATTVNMSFDEKVRFMTDLMTPKFNTKRFLIGLVFWSGFNGLLWYSLIQSPNLGYVLVLLGVAASLISGFIIWRITTEPPPFFP
jgi:hypothetical protein